MVNRGKLKNTKYESKVYGVAVQPNEKGPGIDPSPLGHIK